MVYFIWAIVAILAFIKKDSKIVTLLVTAFIACIFCFNTANADLLAYKFHYLEIQDCASEPLFVLLNKLFSGWAFSFEAFRAVQVFAALFCILSTVFRFSPYPAWTMLLYSIYPLTLDVTQLRFFVGYSLAFFSVRFLADYQITGHKKNIVLFCAFLALATGFHYSCIMYAVLGIMLLNVRKRKIMLYVIIPLCLLTFYALISRMAPLLTSIIGNRKAEIWVAAEKAKSIKNISLIVISRGIPLMLSIFISFVIRERKYAYMLGKNSNSLGIANTERTGFFAARTPDFKTKYYDLRINQCLFVCLLYIYLFSALEIKISGEYERMGRLGLLIGAILISRQIFYLTSFNKVCAQVLLGLAYVAYFVSVMCFKGRHTTPFLDYVFQQVMESNSLFGVTY